MSNNPTNLSAQDVMTFLQQNPDFLLEHPYLLLDMNLHVQHQGAPNLALMQQRLLREENTKLKKQISTMIDSARENELIFKLFSDCQRALWYCKNFQELADILADTLSQSPKISVCQLIPYDTTLEELVSRRFNKLSRYLGRLDLEEQKLLFSGFACQSVALYLLGPSDKPTAILAFASGCADHFSPDNGNLFVNELVSSLQIRLKELA
ncbi:DUF484 family protein [Pseudoalteromonas luteoviolacea]|uniref:DUF484 domain-containing protein n=1 Tax=Pseudoalteromonas luteoviolacea S4054 TaxID=1129367 RepID=A0A0F6AFJ7_9GAMM|nr:DUF484 family protein [Pseudoalteromonas luteoviolacea]AOT09989.1 hypothetical protein S4054249_20175 [Pseudoalteromonas luteoviolacea]AOT14900.1 hypothetical protein S40542_20145 [Pseudoalteromonas luteoviolacea]AOT19816.1 hypothetical protein S4054_20150 [Pseudoalteromonas luteoviolacea]KKE84933.1 hypothetical protein N479_07500 [Pseudoalteromonas luteoviolacea S4054]KZN72550.1 hypothetical protein N481_15090 [Pseudoalteromonas luteoviolacea S4047-1]